MLRSKITIATAILLIMLLLGSWLNYNYEGDRLQRLRMSEPSDRYSIHSTKDGQQTFTHHLPFNPREYIRIIRYNPEIE